MEAVNETNEIIGNFIRYPYPIGDMTIEQTKKQGDLFKLYIRGESGLFGSLKRLKYKIYGSDLLLILFEFYLNPIAYELRI